MKKIAFLMSCCLMLQSVSNAYVVRDVEIKSEKIIPFSFVSDTKNYEDSISIKGLSNVKIEKISLNNGEVEAEVSGNYIDLEFYGGSKSSSLRTVTQTSNLELELVPSDDENSRKITAEVNEDVKEIVDVTGDFSSAKVDSAGKIVIEIDKNATGEGEYDKTKKEKSTVEVKIDNDNKSRNVESNFIELPYEPVGKLKAVSGDTSAVQDIIVDGNSIKVEFDNGTPKLNETSLSDCHTYFWIDRDADGNFKPYNPNSVYSTDKNKITGKGEYLDENEQDELGMRLYYKTWTDYCGAEIDGVRYIFPFDTTKGIPKSSDGEVLKKSTLEIKGQDLNAEKYTVEFSEDGVLYIPEGKLYSMGELVSGTKGWGELGENKSWESKETFINSITGKEEPYVRHYKFFYGPEKKRAFGGFYTYPYSCVLEYEHYKPVKLYSGEVTYTYETEKYVKGYLYDGWIKISYTEEKNVKDYPPTSPYNVKYDETQKIISWQPGNDDYTSRDKLIYEIQMYTDSWSDSINSNIGETSIKYDVLSDVTDIRVRTVDEVNQVSDWANLSDNMIEISGVVSPKVIKSGEKVNIYANTKSLSQIETVTAKCEELGIDTTLIKTSEDKPDYYEISYELMADFLEEDEYIYSTNRRYAKSQNKKERNLSFSSKDTTNGDTVDVSLPDGIEFSRNGTIIFPNGNYLNSPLNIFTYNKKRYYLHMTNEIGITNKVSGKSERLIAFENDINKTKKNYNTIIEFVPKIRINNFNYTDDTPSYTVLEVDRKIADKPLVIRWNTDADGITSFDISIENTKIYNFCVEYSVLEKYVGDIEYIKTQKYLKRYVLSTSGYTYPNKSFKAKWAKIALSVLTRYNVQEFPWLGYKVDENEYVREEYILNYNNDPNVRNTYRTLILDEYASDAAVKKYLKLIKSTNFPIERKDMSTVFANEVLDYNSEFEGIGINTDNKAKEGKYEIELIATDVEGKSCKTILTIIVKNDESQMYPEKEDEIKVAELGDLLLGRFFYKDGQGYLEELSKTKGNQNEGFICAGETLGIDITAKNVEFIDIEFLGDSSIQTLDLLTQKFLIEEPGKDYNEVAKEYDNFPIRIYPNEVDENGESKFKYFYTIPYKTRQTLNSWCTLKDSVLEKIDKSKLFTRISEPYMLKITLNGNKENVTQFEFDVFERWDTVLNRNVSDFVTNSKTKWQLRTDK